MRARAGAFRIEYSEVHCRKSLSQQKRSDSDFAKGLFGTQKRINSAVVHFDYAQVHTESCPFPTLPTSIGPFEHHPILSGMGNTRSC